MRNNFIQSVAVCVTALFISGSTGCHFNGSGKWYSPNSYTWVNPFSPRGSNNGLKPQELNAGATKPSLDGRPNIDPPQGGYNNGVKNWEQPKTGIPDTLAGNSNANTDSSRLAAAPTYGGYSTPEYYRSDREGMYAPNPASPAVPTPGTTPGTAPAYNSGTVLTGYAAPDTYPATGYQPTAGTVTNHPQPTNLPSNTTGTVPAGGYPSAGTPAGTAPGYTQYAAPYGAAPPSYNYNSTPAPTAAPPAYGNAVPGSSVPENNPAASAGRTTYGTGGTTTETAPYYGGSTGSNGTAYPPSGYGY
ncbi:MAG: hypothetical protein LBH00_03245 [Planctomycetaceae bacterium]|jgi:hypothetical protein|nr:hypothetical protein [Planctomycetaceae bacterium]